MEALRDAITPDIGAVILEPIQGEGGIRIPSEGYLQKVREICNEKGVLLIFDEVQTGFRTGAWFAFQHEGVLPDILCVSKGIGNGFPLGATLVTDDIALKVPKGSHGNTFGGNPLAMKVGQKVFEIVERENLHQNAREVGEYFVQKLRDLDSSLIRDIRGKGVMIGVELKRKATKYVKAMQERGLIAIPTGSTIIRFFPPINITREQIDDAMEVIQLTIKN